MNCKVCRYAGWSECMRPKVHASIGYDWPKKMVAEDTQPTAKVVESHGPRMHVDGVTYEQGPDGEWYVVMDWEGVKS